MSDMFKAEIKSFMADISQDRWDMAFGKKEEVVGTKEEENESSKRWWEENIGNDDLLVSVEKKPLSGGHSIQDDE